MVQYPTEVTLMTREVKLRNTVQSKRDPEYWIALCSYTEPITSSRV